MTASVNEKNPRNGIFSFKKILYCYYIETQNVNEKKRTEKKIYMQMRSWGENARNSLKNKRFILFLYRKAIKKQFAAECVFTFEIFSTFCL